jgi:Fe-Mn family superoxide dismutase
MDRRDFMRTAAVAAAGAALVSSLPEQAAARPFSTSALADDVLSQHYPFTLPALGFANDAVEPAVDAMTMSIHHDKHHAAYVTNLNKALETQTALQSKTLQELLTSLSSLPDAVRGPVRNNGGGHANHAMFWGLLAPGGAKAPSGALAAAITRDLGSTATCIAALKAAGLAQFGSGWTWLVRDGSGKLVVRSTPNQDTPLSDGARVLVGVDVWEHAYYLKYQNRRADYLDAVLAALNWDAAGRAFGA